MLRGFEGLFRPVEVSRPPIDRHITSTLEIGKVYFYVIIKPSPISFILYRTQEILYGRIAEFWSRFDVSACVDMNKYWDYSVITRSECDSRSRFFILQL